MKNTNLQRLEIQMKHFKSFKRKNMSTQSIFKILVDVTENWQKMLKYSENFLE